jgi:squalene-hopene/tetraprenyl-beta-curcumene cyclase
LTAEIAYTAEQILDRREGPPGGLPEELLLMMLNDPTSDAAGDPGNFDTALRSTVRAASDWLIANQKPDGHWVGRAESNACMEAQWCLALWFMGLGDHPLRKRLGQSLLDTQRPDGAWQIYHGAPNGDINATVESYAALRSLGFRDEEPALTRAREWIEAQGGLRNVRVCAR